MRRKRYERKAGFRIGNPAAAAVLSLFGNACRKWRTANLIRGAFVQDGADCIPDPSGSQLFRRIWPAGIWIQRVSSAGGNRQNIGTEPAEKGFSIVGVFDRDEDFSGEVLEGIPIRHTDELEQFCQKEKPTVAILCVPKMASQDLVRRLVELGIKGFWNFSHYDIGVYYPDVAVENVHLGDSLMTLCYEMQALENRNEK